MGGTILFSTLFAQIYILRNNTIRADLVTQSVWSIYYKNNSIVETTRLEISESGLVFKPRLENYIGMILDQLLTTYISCTKFCLYYAMAWTLNIPPTQKHFYNLNIRLVWHSGPTVALQKFTILQCDEQDFPYHLTNNVHSC